MHTCGRQPESHQRYGCKLAVIGVSTASGVPVAFPRASAYLALQADREIVFENVKLVLDAGGIKARGINGEKVASHQAFWFAWSQFYPVTELWIE